MMQVPECRRDWNTRVVVGSNELRGSSSVQLVQLYSRLLEPEARSPEYCTLRSSKGTSCILELPFEGYKYPSVRPSRIQWVNIISQTAEANKGRS